MSNNNENKLSFKKKWVIVIFPESKDYSVIPTNWLVYKEKLTEGTIKFCRWPLTTVTSNELKCADDTEPSWETYRVKIVGRNKTYGFDDLNPKLIEVMNNLYRENVATNLMLNRVMVKIEGIEANLQNKNLNTDSSIYLDTEFLTLFPINCTNEFNLIENKIQNSSEFVSKLESFLKSVGGTNPKNHLNRVLAKLFTNEFGIKCSWTGRGKNIEIKIGDSYLIKTTKKIIKEVSTSLFTESDFDKTVSDWLRHANTRHSRTPNI